MDSEQQYTIVDEYGQTVDNQSQILPMIKQEHESAMKHQLDTFEDISKLIRIFRGELYDPDTGKWHKPKDKDGKFINSPMMTERGISDITAQLIEGKSILLSNYDKRTLYLTIRALLNTMTRLIYNNRHVYGIQDTATADAILDICFNHMQAMFLSAENNGMRKYFQTQSKEQHSFITSTQNPTGGGKKFLGRF